MFTLSHNPAPIDFHLEALPDLSPSHSNLVGHLLAQFHARITGGVGLLESLSQSLSSVANLTPADRPEELATWILLQSFPEIFGDAPHLISVAPTASLSPAITPEHRKLLVEQATGWLDVPYQWGGNSREGIDCSHLVHQVYNGAGLDYPFTTTTQDWEKAGFHQVTEPEAGDVILWSPVDGNSYGHVGIVIDPEKQLFIGAQTPVEKASYAPDRYWGRRPFIFLRFGPPSE